MLKLDNTLLDELGLGSLPEDQKRAMLQHIYETLELRVGTNLANQMSNEQLEEFEKFIDDEGNSADQAQALQWLEANLPNYKQVVNDVFEALKAEIKQMAPQLLAASTSQPPQAPMPAQQAMPPANPYSAQPTGSGYTGYAAPQPQQPMTPPAQPYQAPQPQPGYGQQPQFTQPATPAPAGYQPPMPSQPSPAPMQQPDPMAPQQPPVYPGAPADPQNGSGVPQQPPAAPQDNTGAGGYPPSFPQQQPPAGPGNYPRQ